MNRLIEHISNGLRRLPDAVVQGLTVAGVLLTGLVDYVTGREIAFAAFYLLPLSAAAFQSRRRFGVTVSLLAAITWLGADLAAGQGYSHVWIPVWNTATRLATFVLVTSLLTTLHRAHARVEKLASMDPLTGVANARSFDSVARRMVKECHERRRPLTLAYIDIDDFKRINGSVGHSGGDRVLRAVAGALSDGVRGSDLVARMGGDEFIILFPQTGSEAAKAILRDLADRMTSALKDMPAHVELSVGAVTYLTPPAIIDEMVSEADRLMYEVKASGKNSFSHKTVVSESASAAPDTTASRDDWHAKPEAHDDSAAVWIAVPRR